MNKIRCRFLDRSTGMPVPGVIASLSVAIGDAPKSLQLPVATLCTDATGYMSFDLKPLIDLGLVTASGFFITAPKFGLTNYDLLGSLVAAPVDGAEKKDINLSGSEASYIKENMTLVATTIGENKELPCIVFPVYLDKRLRDENGSESATCEPTRLPSIQSPDACDYKVSPFSFVTPTAVNLGNDCCEILLPSSIPIQQYRFFKVIIRRDDTGATGVAIDNTPLKNRVKVVDGLKAEGAVIKFGEILEYRQDWYSLGHSLGEIKYSLPLAPGESAQLAVIEWSRDDLASRTDKIRATEFLDHDSRRDRAIEETVEAALREEQGGNSHMGSTSGTASGSTYGTGMWTGNHAFGGGISYSYGNRDLEADSLHDLHDRVRQTSSSIRSLNSTVIVQGTQTEQNALQTRRIANHNHCHAMTIQYYEVLRHYRMSTKFSGRRKAILIPFEPFAFKSSVAPAAPQASWDLALRFRTILEQTLLDPSLKDCFEALIRLNVAPSSVYDAPKPTKPDVLTPPKSAKRPAVVEVDGSKEAGVDSGVTVLVGDKVKVSASGLLAFYLPQGRGSGGFGPEGDIGKIAPAGGHFPFIADKLVELSLIYKIGGTGAWRQGGRNFEVTAKTPEDDVGNIFFGVNNHTGYFQASPAGKVWTVNMEYPSHETEPTPTDPSKDDAANSKAYRKSDDELCEARLLRHLQDNQGFYNGAVWLLMDAVERRLYLEQALLDRLEILDGIDDRPIAISGNYVAFQYSGPLAQWSDSRDDDPKAPIEDIVTLPTRGLLAEAQMGHCNSCEKRDVTRMWDWTEMTAETPPEISGISPGPKGVAPSIMQGQLPPHVIQITQPQAAPDPTGLANALSVLKTPDIFRDMAGLEEVSKLLGELVKASGDANSKAMATQAKAKVDGMKGSGGGAGTGAVDSSASQTPGERYDNLQVAKEAAKAAQELGWDDGRTANITSDIVSGGGGGFYSTVRDMVEDAIKGTKPATLPTEHKTLAEKAKLIADQPILVKAYENFQKKTWGWWFSPNGTLDGGVSKSAKLNDWSDWDSFDWRQRTALADVAEVNANSLGRNDANLSKLKAGLKQWPDNYYAVFQSGLTADTNTCNLFLGDALTLDGRAQVQANGKYYSAQQAHRGEGGFREVPLFYVVIGDVACWGGHVEIVTEVNYSEGTFCSRGGFRTPPGSEICEEKAKTGRRKFDCPGLRFMRVA